MLTQSLAALLPFKGIKIAEGNDAGAWRVEGTVKVKAKSQQLDIVTLTWRVVDGQGKEAGTITQENAVPRGRLDGKWGEIAGFAGEAAAEGIAQLIHSFATKPAGAAGPPASGG
jgi:hypothetical protein